MFPSRPHELHLTLHLFLKAFFVWHPSLITQWFPHVDKIIMAHFTLTPPIKQLFSLAIMRILLSDNKGWEHQREELKRTISRSFFPKKWHGWPCRDVIKRYNSQTRVILTGLCQNSTKSTTPAKLPFSLTTMQKRPAEFENLHNSKESTRQKQV